MSVKSLAQELRQHPQKLIANYCTSMRLQAFHRGEMTMNFCFGRPYKYYDLASLTKVLLTTSVCMQITAKQPRFLSEKILGFKVKDLLSHGSGLKAWQPLYNRIDYQGTWQQRRQQLQEYFASKTHMLKQKNFRVGAHVYSDLDFMLLGLHLEEKLSSDLNSIWQKFAKPKSLNKIHFNLNNKTKYKKSLYAPTFSHQWQPKKLQGVVNDANTRALGGVSSHAGLFGSIDDLSHWGLLLRKSLQGKPGGLQSPPLVKKFCRQVSPGFACGFIKPTPSSTSGQYFSKSSVGHLGYTGVSVWYDPKRDLLVNIVANRNIPDVKGRTFAQLRPLLHDLVVESL